jgi:tripartite-type tricarboxylate transporter receptor subunit TctC
VPDLIAFAKQRSGELSYGSGGPGHTAHLLAEMLWQRTGVQMAHVPYRGSPPALNDLVAGHIQVMFADILPSLQLIAEGKVRALAVSSRNRVPSAPQIPPIAEAAGLPGFEGVAWIMFMTPAKTPPQIVNRLRAELVPILEAADVQSWIVKNGMIPAQFQGVDQRRLGLSSEVVGWRGGVGRLGGGGGGWAGA